MQLKYKGDKDTIEKKEKMKKIKNMKHRRLSERRGKKGNK